MKKAPSNEPSLSPEIPAGIDSPPELTEDQRRAVQIALDTLDTRSDPGFHIHTGVTSDGLLVSMRNCTPAVESSPDGRTAPDLSYVADVYEGSVDSLDDNEPLDVHQRTITGRDILFYEYLKEGMPLGTPPPQITIGGKRVFPLDEECQPYSPEARAGDVADESTARAKLSRLDRIKLAVGYFLQTFAPPNSRAIEDALSNEDRRIELDADTGEVRR